jgi:hypothetical protein
MADLGILDYLGYAVLPNMMRMAQGRQKEIDQSRIGAFRDYERTFGLPQPGPDDAVRGSVQREMGMPYPKAERQTPVGVAIEYPPMRSSEDLKLRDARITGQASGIQAGEAERAQRPYIPGATDFKMGQLKDMLSATGENPAEFSIAETMGMKRRTTSKEDDPKTLENLAARQLQSRDYAGAEQTLKMLKDLKARDHAPPAFNIDQQLWQAAGGDPNRYAELKRSSAAPSTSDTPADRRLRQIEQDINSRVMKKHGITAGENIVSEAMGEKGPEVAGKIDQEIEMMKQEYIALGGNPARLGLGGQTGGQSQYKTPDDVKAAYKEGKITRDQAATVLRQQFGMQ